MKKTIKVLSFLAILLSIGACNNNSNTSSSLTTPVVGPSSATTSEPISIPDEADVNNKLKLKMFGGLYNESIRTIYAIFQEGISGELIWSTSNDEVVTITPREGLTSEAMLLVRGYGEARITASLADDPNIAATYDFVISEGEAMPVELFNKIKGGVRLVSDDQMLSFDKNYQETIEERYTITTIFEENNPENTEESNITDAYQIDVVNCNTNENEYHLSYVKGTGSYVATEGINVGNNIISEQVILEETGEGLKWGASYYQNIWNLSSIVSNEDFRTFDGGKTYHYASYYTTMSELCQSMYLTYMDPDGMYFEVDGDELKLHVVIDPYNKDVTAETKYGRHIITTFDSFGTAEIDHLDPYAHEEQHDKLSSALEKMAELKNYEVSYTMDYPGSVDDVTYEFIFTEDTVDQVVKNNGVIVNHTGAHKQTENSYYQYDYNDLSNKMLITDIHNTKWEEANLYPTFAFASEVFDEIETNVYKCRLDTGIFLAYCVYLNAAVSYYDFCYPGTITLSEDGYIQEISTKLDALGEDLTITATFSSFESAECNIDFSAIGEESLPSSYKEANEYLYSDLVKWNLDEVVPYVYCQPGYQDYVGWERKEDEEGVSTDEVNYAFFETNPFDTPEEAAAYIELYIQELIDNGFVETEEKFAYNNKEYTFYQKGEYKIAIGKVVNWWNGYEPGGVIIAIKSDLLVAPIE